MSELDPSADPSPDRQAATLRLREPARRVDPRARALWRLEGLLASIVVAAVLSAVLVPWVGWRWWYLAVYLGLLAGLVLAVPQWRWAVHRWEVSGTAVYTQTGWYAVERRIAPMSRIQTVDFHQPVLERLLGLATVTVTTASAAGPLRIAGLDRETAERLAADLTRQADGRDGDAT